MTYTRPAASFYVWVTLPDWIDTRAMLVAAVERRVAYVPGDRFLPRRARRQPDAARVLLSTAERIREGIARLGSLLDDDRGLYGSLHP